VAIRTAGLEELGGRLREGCKCRSDEPVTFGARTMPGFCLRCRKPLAVLELIKGGRRVGLVVVWARIMAVVRLSSGSRPW